MKLSVIIPFLNDEGVLFDTLDAVLGDMPKTKVEVIIVDDGSHTPLKIEGDKRVKVVRLERTQGVGLAFNQGVEIAKSCNIVLMGCDVIPQEGWYKTVVQDLNGGPSTIYCSVTLRAREDGDHFRDDQIRRYGANLSYMTDNKMLPLDSKDRHNDKFAKILQTHWNYIAPSRKRFVDTSCVLGGFYWMLKEDFQKIHGFNGHFRWGSLEPLLSLKARAHGIDLRVDKNVESAHYFDREITRSIRPDYIYYNMLLLAHTLFLESMRDELIDYLLYDDDGNKRGRLNVNQAVKLVKRNHGLIQTERDYNDKHFKKGLISNWEKFFK